jgi:pyruvate dehydrogenase E1 component alpha subunit
MPEEDSAVPEMWMKACAYDMAAERIDGMDFFSVREATQRAVTACGSTREPMFLEAFTYRFRGHSMADAGRYRSQDEVREWQRRDPIQLLGRRLEEDGILDTRTREDVEKAVDEEVERATRFALESPSPEIDDLYQYVYTEEDQ